MEILPRSVANPSAAARATNANERHAPAIKRAAVRVNRIDLSIVGEGFGEAGESTRRRQERDHAAAISHPIRYFRFTLPSTKRSAPAHARSAIASVPTKKIVAGARKYFVPGMIAYGI